ASREEDSAADLAPVSIPEVFPPPAGAVAEPLWLGQLEPAAARGPADRPGDRMRNVALGCGRQAQNGLRLNAVGGNHPEHGDLAAGESARRIEHGGGGPAGGL